MEYDMMQDKKKKKINRLCVAIITLCALLNFLKGQFGFDWSDEAFYTAIEHRMVNGDAPFVSSVGSAQLFAIIMSPFTWLFEHVTGGTTGIMLFNRMPYNTVIYFVALLLFNKVKSETKAGALIVSVLCILFVPHSIGTMSYNSVLYLCIIWTIAIFFDYDKKQSASRIKMLFGGVVYAIAVMDYPSMIITYPLFMAFFLYENRKELGVINKISDLFFFCIGCAIVLCVLLIIILSTSSITNVIAAFSGAQDHRNAKVAADMVYADPIRNYFYSMMSSLGRLVYVVLAYTACLVAYIPLKKSDKNGYARMILVIPLIVAFFILLYRTACTDVGYNLINVCLALTFPGCAILFYQRNDWAFLTYIVGIVTSMAIFIGTDTGIRGASYGLMVSNVGAITYLISYYGKADGYLNGRCLQYIGLLMGIALIAFILSSKFSYVYRDASCNQLDTRIEKGPAAGIYTTDENVRRYNEVVETVEEYIKDDDIVLYSKLMPLAYAVTCAKPSYESMFTIDIASRDLEGFLKEHPDRMPTKVLVFDEEYGIANEDNPIKGYLGEQLNSDEYRKVDLKCGTLFEKTS